MSATTNKQRGQTLSKTTKLLSAESFSDNRQNTSLLLITMAEEYESKIRNLEAQLAEWRNRCEMLERREEQYNQPRVITEHTETVEIEERFVEYEGGDDEAQIKETAMQNMEFIADCNGERDDGKFLKEHGDGGSMSVLSKQNLNVDVLNKIRNLFMNMRGEEANASCQTESAYSELVQGMQQLGQTLEQFDTSGHDGETECGSSIGITLSMDDSKHSTMLDSASSFGDDDLYIIDQKNDCFFGGKEPSDTPIRVTALFLDQLHHVMGDDLAEEVWRASSGLEMFQQGEENNDEAAHVHVHGDVLVTALEILMNERSSFLDELAALYEVEEVHDVDEKDYGI